MINTFYEKLAKLAINYSIGVKKEDRVFISGHSLAEELFQALYIETIKAGGHPSLNLQIEGFQESDSSQGKKKERRKKISKEYVISPDVSVWVQKDDLVSRGQQISEGPVDLKEMFKLANQEAVQRYIIKEVQKIYSTQGGGLNDKHIEVIIKQMLSRVRVKDAGDTNLLAGAVMEKDQLLEANDKIRKAGKKAATFYLLVMGISKVALTTQSFLSAASFQETVRVLIQAATEGRIDSLRGLKENVIIGKLIPAGTGFRKKPQVSNSKPQIHSDPVGTLRDHRGTNPKFK